MSIFSRKRRQSFIYFSSEGRIESTNGNQNDRCRMKKTNQESQSEEDVQVDRININQTSKRSERAVAAVQTFDGIIIY